MKTKPVKGIAVFVSITGAIAPLLVLGAPDSGQILKTLRTQDDLASSAQFMIHYKVDTAAHHYQESSTVSYIGSDYVIDRTIPTGQVTSWNDGPWNIEMIDRSVVIRDGKVRGITLDPSATPRAIGPLFCQGRGLSHLTEVSVNGNVLTGKFRGRQCRAVLDPANAYLATKIELLASNGQTVADQYVNSDPHRDARGFVYSGHSISALGTTRKEFTIDNVVTGLTTLAKPKWLGKGNDIGDERVSPGVGYTYEDVVKLNGGKEPTLAQLLPITQKQRDELDARKVADVKLRQGIEDGRQTERTKRTAFTLVALAASVCLFLFGRKTLVSVRKSS